MMKFLELPETVQIVFLALQFIVFCIGVCTLPMVFQKRRWLPKQLLPFLMLFSGGMLSVFSASVRVKKTGAPLPAVTQWAVEQPVWISATLLVAVLGYMIFLICSEKRYRQRVITRFSIKEGLDSLSSGLCFCEPNGKVILTNSRMKNLCHKITGQELQNADIFWRQLQNGKVNNDVVRLSAHNALSFLLPDGTVWSFMWEKLDGIFQLTAADITQIYRLTTKLEQENKQLESLNQRLRDYGENADALTRAKERLEIKVKVHGMLGQALLATRRCLQDEGISTDEAMSLWRHSVAVLHKEAVQETKKPLEALKKAAAATGITLELKGEIPEEAKVRQLFLQAAAESLTNAISHAKAKTLYVDFAEDPYAYRVSIYNDGLLPTGPVREGGGLSALRKNVERIGGQMEIKSVPQFILTVTIGKGGDRDV